jgi:hypothetical protein
MTDRPILFSGPMVRALLEGRKTQTRRVHKAPTGLEHLAGSVLPRFEVGDRLWTRETWAPKTNGFLYGADWLPSAYDGLKPWRPSIFMPRRASRLTLTVTDVRVQRVQDISATDAEEEGVRCDMSPRTFVDHFHRLWDSLNASRGYGWEANPWVVALTFTVARQNIDAALSSAPTPGGEDNG